MDPRGYVSMVTPSTVVAEGVYQFLRGSLCGAIWGAVTPFHAPGSAGALAEAATGVFRPAPVSLASVPYNAAMFGSVVGVQRLANKSCEFLRRKEDVWNDFFGFFVSYRYYLYFFGSTEKRMILHNRVVGLGVCGALLYANVLV